MAPRKTDPLKRLLEKLQITEAGCAEWTHYIERTGYARIWVDGRNVLAHRWMYERFRQTIPVGLVIDHLCRNRACVNPAHLEAVTSQINTLRGDVPLYPHNAYKLFCPAGHPYSAENTYTGSRGRVCFICKKTNARAYYERNRALVIERSRLNEQRRKLRKEKETA